MTPSVVPASQEEYIVRAHGGGGEMMSRLIRGHIVAALGNRTLDALTDGAILPSETSRIVITTDSFVVQPLEFPGGDIGRLAVCGTVNDLAVMGGRPIGLSCGLIIEEGFELTRLDRILASIAEACREAHVEIVTGDTKVIDRGTGGGLLINTAGVASLDEGVHMGMARVEAGDAIIVNGTLGDHGLAVMSVRSGLEFETEIVSDAAPLNGLVDAVLEAGIDVRFMRDATRGGLAGVLADVAEEAKLGVELDESRIPRRPSVYAAAEMLGFDLLTVANEGKIVFIVPSDQADQCVDVMRRHPRGAEAATIGRIVDREACYDPLVELITTGGGRRLVQRPYGEELPRIC